MMTHRFLIALGANSTIENKSLIEKLRHGASAVVEYQNNSFIAASGLYETSPVGCGGRQPRYLNAVILIEARPTLVGFLRWCKRLEREHGRRQRGLNAARPLDIDLLDIGGRILGHRALRPARHPVRPPNKAGHAASKRCLTNRRRIRDPRSWLTLPHPEMHKRRFVLEPLLEVAPYWRHPVIGATARQLVARLPRPPGQIRRILDSQWLSCDKQS